MYDVCFINGVNGRCNINCEKFLEGECDGDYKSLIDDALEAGEIDEDERDELYERYGIEEEYGLDEERIGG